MLQFQNMIYTIYYFDLDVEEKVEVPESDENVVNDDLSDLDRWSRCRDNPKMGILCRIFTSRGTHVCYGGPRGQGQAMRKNCPLSCGICRN